MPERKFKLQFHFKVNLWSILVTVVNAILRIA